MKKYVLWSLILAGVIAFLIRYGSRDYSQIYFVDNSAEKIIAKVEWHREELEKINADYEEKKGYRVYEGINDFLFKNLASPEIMDRWYKIWLESISKSEKYANNKEYLNQVSCLALVWFIRAGDKKSVQELPVLTAYPLFEEARKRYLHSSPQEFAEWAKKNINGNIVPPKHLDEAINYFGLLESAALTANDLDLARHANALLYNYALRDWTFSMTAAYKLVDYVDRIGKVTDEDREILVDHYLKNIKDSRLSSSPVLREHEECVLRILKKYQLVKSISVRPSYLEELRVSNRKND